MADLKILITGASSKTAEALIKLFKYETGHKLILLSSRINKLKQYEGYDYHRVNSLSFKDIKTLCYDMKPDIIINTAGFTDVDKCEDDRKTAWDLNVTLVEYLASISRVIDSHLITFSSDYVFDGNRGPYIEEDRPNPINFYGKTKHAMENACLSNLNKITVVRTNSIYGYSSTGKVDFIRWVLYKLEQGYGVNIVTSQYCNPTYVEDIAVAVNKIITKKRTGVYHIGGTDWLNRYDIALKTARVFGYDETLIKPVAVAELNQTAKRPVKGGLVTLKAETDLGIKLTSLESGLMALRHQLRDNKFSFVVK